VGFENNLHLPDGGLARDNAALVSNFVQAAAAVGMRAATARAARKLLFNAN
jgi:uncharacterized protein (DUF849 family)